MPQENKLIVFEDKQIRCTWYNGEWWFAIVDIVSVLTDSSDPKQYIQRMKQRDTELSKGWVQISFKLKEETPAGRGYKPSPAGVS